MANEPAADAAPAPITIASPADGGVKPAEFQDLAGAGATARGAPNLDLVRDIQVMLTVELGRSEMLIQDILELANGKVIELDRQIGEPLDILINGKLLARGEVVMVDDRFGIRVTAIVDAKAREAALKG